MAIVIATGRPKLVRNLCVIEVFGGVFVLSLCFLGFSVGVGAFVIGLSLISSFFSSSQNSLFSTSRALFLKQDQITLQFYFKNVLFS